MSHLAPRRPLALVAALLATCASALAWSEQGHRIVALAAEEYLSDNAKRRVGYLLGPDVRLVDVATWANEIVQERPEIEAWHSITIPKGAERVDLTRDCPVGDCITVKAREFLGIIRLGLKTQEERLDALRFLIHLMGELHQPLHAGFSHDRGGNDIAIVFHGEESTLHKLWDSDLLGKHISDEDLFAAQLLSEIRPQDEKRWSRGHLKEWTWESRQLALEAVYDGLAGEEPKNIDDAYRRRAWEVAKEQLAKGGIRLAVIMNEIWGH